MGKLKEIIEDRPIPKHFWGMTQAMFYEFRFIMTNTKTPIFNMLEKDHRGTRSMYQLYMSYDTEYEAAKGILGSWNHWQKLCLSPWFAKEKEKWDVEKNLYIESIAFSTLLKEAKAGDTSAAKALITRINRREKELLNRKGAGRPKNKNNNDASTLKAEEYELDIMLDRFQAVNGNRNT